MKNHSKIPISDGLSMGNLFEIRRIDRYSKSDRDFCLSVIQLKADEVDSATLEALQLEDIQSLLGNWMTRSQYWTSDNQPSLAEIRSCLMGRVNDFDAHIDILSEALGATSTLLDSSYGLDSALAGIASVDTSALFSGFDALTDSIDMQLAAKLYGVGEVGDFNWLPTSVLDDTLRAFSETVAGSPLSSIRTTEIMALAIPEYDLFSSVGSVEQALLGEISTCSGELEQEIMNSLGYALGWNDAAILEARNAFMDPFSYLEDEVAKSWNASEIFMNAPPESTMSLFLPEMIDAEAYADSFHTGHDTLHLRRCVFDDYIATE